jgi:hypothetical protein
MAKETKQDRIVRNIQEQVTEHLHEIKNMDANPSTKESDVEKWCASFLKNCFGYTAVAGYSIRSQESKGRLRPDLLVLKNDKPIFLVEVKNLGFNFDKSDFRSGKIQLTEYLNAVGNVKWGILTNGVDWKLYDFSNPQNGGVEIAKFNLKTGEGDTFAFDKKSIEDLCYEMLDFHESTYASKSWEDLGKEATAFSPESLAKAILSADVVKYIGKSIRGEHEFKANLEILTDKVFNLIEKGLDDSIPGWNEQKALDYHKYIKAQKRAGRKVKKKSEFVTTTQQVIPEVQVTVTVDTSPLVASVVESQKKSVA